MSRPSHAHLSLSAHLALSAHLERLSIRGSGQDFNGEIGPLPRSYTTTYTPFELPPGRGRRWARPVLNGTRGYLLRPRRCRARLVGRLRAGRPSPCRYVVAGREVGVVEQRRGDGDEHRVGDAALLADFQAGGGDRDAEAPSVALHRRRHERRETVEVGLAVLLVAVLCRRMGTMARRPISTGVGPARSVVSECRCTVIALEIGLDKRRVQPMCSHPTGSVASRDSETPALAGASGKADDGTRTHDLLHGNELKRAQDHKSAARLSQIALTPSV